MQRSPSLLGAVLVVLLVGSACGGESGAYAGAPPAPVLVTGPAPRVVPLGSTWTFTVTATGANLSYQWRKGGQALPGATAATYAFTPVSAQDGGSLDVVVSNGGGSVASPLVAVSVPKGPGTRI